MDPGLPSCWLADWLCGAVLLSAYRPRNLPGELPFYAPSLVVQLLGASTGSAIGSEKSGGDIGQYEET